MGKQNPPLRSELPIPPHLSGPNQVTALSITVELPCLNFRPQRTAGQVFWSWPDLRFDQTSSDSEAEVHLYRCVTVNLRNVPDKWHLSCLCTTCQQSSYMLYLQSLHGKVWKLASLSHTKCYINITGHSYRKEGLHSEPYGHFTTMHIISREQKKSTHATESGRKIKEIKMCYEQI